MDAQKPFMNSTNLTRTLLAIACVSFIQTGYAQQTPEQSMLPCDEVEQQALADVTPDEIKSITAFTPAEIIERKNPRYPVQAARKNREGWVKVSYVIDTEGNVQDPVIFDNGGDNAFKRAAMSAIKDWKFAPAMKNGKPTEQCHQAVRMDFTMGGNAGASRRFASKYRELSELIRSGEIDQAETLLSDLKEGEYRNRYENAFMWSLDATIAKALNDVPRELSSIKRTIASSASHRVKERVFDNAYMGYLHLRKFSLEVTQNYFADALNTAADIESLKNSAELSASIQETLKKIEAFIDSSENLFIQAKLSGKSSFFHLLARNQFAFTDIQGELETVEVRCDTHREKFTVAEEFVWSIPESWGQCQVLVQGKSGTSFNLVEVNQA